MHKPKLAVSRHLTLFVLVVSLSLFVLTGAVYAAIAPSSLKGVPMQPGTERRPVDSFVKIRVIDRSHFFVEGGNTDIVAGKNFGGIINGVYTDGDLDGDFRYDVGDGLKAPFIDELKTNDAPMAVHILGENFDYMNKISGDEISRVFKNMEMTIVKEDTDMDAYLGTDVDCTNPYIFSNFLYIEPNGGWKCFGGEQRDIVAFQGLFIDNSIEDKDNFNITFRYNATDKTIKSTDGRVTLSFCNNDVVGAPNFQPSGDLCTGDSNVFIMTDPTAMESAANVDVLIRNRANDNFTNVTIAGPNSSSAEVATEIDASDPAADVQTCASESGSEFGWVLCPVIEGSQQALDWIWGTLLEPLLSFEIEGNSVQSVWAGFRTIANILFVLAFLAVIYSAATGSMLSAYDVRKLLPRLFIVAIMVQLSLFASLFLLDTSNVIGSGVRSIILYPLSTEGVEGDASIEVGGFASQEHEGTVYTIATDATDILVGTGLGVIMLIILLVLTFYSLTGLILLAGVFIVRDIGLVMLIVVSPVAFALMVLPGTEDYFRKWWKWYFGLLAMYPIMAAFIASGELVAAIWTRADAFPWPLGFIVGTIALFMPYFVAPKVLKYAGAAAGAMTGAFSVLNDKKNKLKESGTFQRTKQRATGNAWNAAAGSKFAKSSLGGRAFSSRTIGRRAGVAAQQLEKLNQEDAAIGTNYIATQTADMSKEDEKAFLAKQITGNTSDGMKRAAMKKMLVNKDVFGLELAFNTLEAKGASGKRLLTNFKAENQGDLNGTARHLLVGQEKDGASRQVAGASSVAKANGDKLVTQSADSLKSIVGTLSSDAAANPNKAVERKREIQQMAQTIHDMHANENTRSQVNEDALKFANQLLAGNLTPTQDDANKLAKTNTELVNAGSAPINTGQII